MLALFLVISETKFFFIHFVSIIYKYIYWIFFMFTCSLISFWFFSFFFFFFVMFWLLSWFIENTVYIVDTCRIIAQIIFLDNFVFFFYLLNELHSVIHWICFYSCMWFWRIFFFGFKSSRRLIGKKKGTDVVFGPWLNFIFGIFVYSFAHFLFIMMFFFCGSLGCYNFFLLKEDMASFTEGLVLKSMRKCVYFYRLIKLINTDLKKKLPFPI